MTLTPGARAMLSRLQTNGAEYGGELLNIGTAVDLHHLISVGYIRAWYGAYIITPTGTAALAAATTPVPMTRDEALAILDPARLIEAATALIATTHDATEASHARAIRARAQAMQEAQAHGVRNVQ